MSQGVIILRYYEGMSLAQAGELLGLDKDEARKRWETAVLTVHDALLQGAAIADGCACGGRCACR